MSVSLTKMCLQGKALLHGFIEDRKTRDRVHDRPDSEVHHEALEPTGNVASITTASELNCASKSEALAGTCSSSAHRTVKIALTTDASHEEIHDPDPAWGCNQHLASLRPS